MNAAPGPSSTELPLRELPTRVVRADEARERHGARADELLSWLWRTDPLADAVVAAFVADPRQRAVFERWLKQAEGTASGDDVAPALRAFFEHLECVPSWVDWRRVDRAGRVFFRSGLAGGIVLGAKSLCQGYCSPGGNKPLVMTGQLDGAEVGMRLARTGKFVLETCRRRGLCRDGLGFAITVRVRLLHAEVRRTLLASERWSNAAWGVPINQHDMLGTGLLFSQSFIDGVREFGFAVSPQEAADYLHLWRYASYLMGVDVSLFPTSEVDAYALADIIRTTQGSPDDDSRRLVDALVRSPERFARTPKEQREARLRTALGYAFCRSMLGEELADGLGLPRDGWRHTVPVVGRLVSALEPIRRQVGLLDRAYRQAGDRYWQREVAAGLTRPRGPAAVAS